MISVDENGPQLYHMDPSGTYLQFDAKAIGSGSEGAQQSLQEAYHKSITLKEATKTAFTILKQVSAIISRDNTTDTFGVAAFGLNKSVSVL